MKIPPPAPGPPSGEGDEHEKRHWTSALFFPALFVGLLWGIHLWAYQAGVSLNEYGVFPRKWEGLVGILTGPLVHGSWNHLIDNSVPLLVLGWAMFYFYRPIAFPVFFWTYLMSGAWVWVSARPSWHIGASGLVYGFVAFLFLSGILRKHVKLMAISLLVIFLYGSLFWGLLPVVPRISWEGHLWGTIAGVILALYYRREGPQRPLYEWEKEELEEEQEQQQEQEGKGRKIVYYFRKRGEDEG